MAAATTSPLSQRLNDLGLELQGLARQALEACGLGDVAEVTRLVNQRVPLVEEIRAIASRDAAAVTACAAIAEAARLENELTQAAHARRDELFTQLTTARQRLALRRAYSAAT